MSNILNIPYRNKMDSFREFTISNINKKSEIYKFPVFLSQDINPSGGLEICCQYSDITSIGRIISANENGIQIQFYFDPNIILTQESCIDVVSYTGVYNTESPIWKTRKPMWFSGIIYNTKEV